MSRSPSAELAVRLSQVRHVVFESLSEGSVGWTGTAGGTVQVRASETQVVFEEAGTWTASAPGRPPVAFKNIFRWSIEPHRIGLEHLRFGPDHPVFLFHLIPESPHEWREELPHACGGDRYRASLSWDDGGLRMIWQIAGPRKRETLAYRYW